MWAPHIQPPKPGGLVEFARMKRRAPCQMSRRNHSALAHFHRTSAARMGIAGLAVFSATDIDVLAPLLRLSNCQQFAQDRWRLGAIVALACPRHRSSSFQPARHSEQAMNSYENTRSQSSINEPRCNHPRNSPASIFASWASTVLRSRCPHLCDSFVGYSCASDDLPHTIHYHGGVALSSAS